MVVHSVASSVDHLVDRSAVKKAVPMADQSVVPRAGPKAGRWVDAMVGLSASTMADSTAACSELSSAALMVDRLADLKADLSEPRSADSMDLPLVDPSVLRSAVSSERL